MALGTVTTVASGGLAAGPGERAGLRFAIIDVVPTSGANYTANGEAIALANFPGFTEGVLFASVVSNTEASGDVYRYVYEPSTTKLVVIQDDGTSGVPAEVAASTNLSTRSVRIFAVGR